MQQQLTLGMPMAEENTFANFFPGANEEVVSHLKQMIHGDSDVPLIYLYGAKGVGKTHLLLAAIREMKMLASDEPHGMYLTLQSIDQLQANVLEGLDTLPGMVIDDIHCLAGKPAWEEAFLDFYHRQIEARRFLIVAGNTIPHHIPFHLKDIASRLSAFIVFQVKELTEEEKLFALITRAKSRGFLMPDRVVRFLLKKYPRDLGSLFSALDILDRASLVEKRRVTIPFVKQVLGI